MGQDYYETVERGRPPARHSMGIGHGSVIERTIVDKNARIGDGVRITPDGKPANFDGPNFYVRDGLVVIPKNAIVPDGTHRSPERNSMQERWWRTRSVAAAIRSR